MRRWPQHLYCLHWCMIFYHRHRTDYQLLYFVHLDSRLTFISVSNSLRLVTNLQLSLLSDIFQTFLLKIAHLFQGIRIKMICFGEGKFRLFFKQTRMHVEKPFLLAFWIV